MTSGGGYMDGLPIIRISISVGGNGGEYVSAFQRQCKNINLDVSSKMDGGNDVSILLSQYNDTSVGGSDPNSVSAL
jgi:hypothetical protein